MRSVVLSGQQTSSEEAKISEQEWVDIVEAARRFGCSAQAVRRRIKDGALTSRKRKLVVNNGRTVTKFLIRLSDLNDGFGWAAREAHVRKIRATAGPLTDEQKIALRKVLLAHLMDREEKRKRTRAGGAPAKTFSKLL